MSDDPKLKRIKIALVVMGGLIAVNLIAITILSFNSSSIAGNASRTATKVEKVAGEVRRVQCLGYQARLEELEKRRVTSADPPAMQLFYATRSIPGLMRRMDRLACVP